MSDAGIVTVQSGQFNVTTNSGVTESELSARLKPSTDKARSEAASQLGKAGAEARKAKAEAEPEEKAEPEAEAKPERKIKPIPPKVEAKAEPEKGEEEAEPEDKAEEAKPEPEKPKDKRGDPRHDPNARIREATREAAEARRQLAEERARREALEARLSAPERPQAPSFAAQPDSKLANGKPNPADYQTTEEWLDARDAYNRQEWERELGRRAQEQAQENQLRQVADRFREAATPIVGKISEEVGALRTTFQLAPGEQESGENWIANELVFSPESAPALMLHFSAQPEELQRIAALKTPRAVSREMAKIEARLEAATTASASSPEREDHSRATPPVRPVTGAPYVTGSDEYKPGMSLDEYRKVWEKQTRRR
jgi:hypothetical protein